MPARWQESHTIWPGLVLAPDAVAANTSNSLLSSARTAHTSPFTIALALAALSKSDISIPTAVNSSSRLSNARADRVARMFGTMTASSARNSSSECDTYRLCVTEALVLKRFDTVLCPTRRPVR